MTVLRAGGNAADAAAAAAFAVAVVEPYSSGIGGGGFAMVRHGKQVLFLDFREVAPRQASRDMYVRNGTADGRLSRDGILSVAVPGAVAGYLALQQRFGRLSREQVLAPAIALASSGFLVDARYQGYTAWRLELLRKDPEAARIFLVPGTNGKPPETPPLGHRIIQHDLARTLRTLARQGAQAFYSGAIANKLVADMKQRGGLITATDLRRYEVRDRTPLIGSFRGHTIATAPPPSAGGQVILTILNLMETLPPKTPWHDDSALHLYIEASKQAFADRYLIADPTFVSDVTPQLIAKERALRLSSRVSQRAADAKVITPGTGAQLPSELLRRLPIPKAKLDSMHTTHLCTIDAEGNAVSLTTTVNYGWGSGVVARGTGVLWNDEMDDFAIAPGVPNAYGIVGADANAIAPGKTPLSSMSPTLVFAGPSFDAPLRMVVGSPGGPRIPTTVAQVILNHLEYGAPIDKAVDLGRLHHQHLPDRVSVEPFALDPATRQRLQNRGHRFEDGQAWSNATAIAVDPGTGLRTGSADHRGVGTAAAQ